MIFGCVQWSVIEKFYDSLDPTFFFWPWEVVTNGDMLCDVKIATDNKDYGDILEQVFSGVWGLYDWVFLSIFCPVLYQYSSDKVTKALIWI